jgi:hypothetical protein
VSTTPSEARALVSIFAGQVCIGFVLNRGEAGFEAFAAADERSLGRFPTQREAAAALRAFCDEGER